MLFQSHQLVGVLSLIDFERVARAHLPRPLFHYVYESLEDGAGHCDNRDAFAEFGFVARALTNVSRRSVRTTLFNRSDAQPFGIAPMGLAALTAYRGDLVIVRAGVNVPHDLGPREHLDWELVRLTCKTWKGNLVVKGLLAIEDALTAKNCGADGLILSNHSGRQFDGTVSALRVLHGICTAVDDLALVLDGLAHRCIASRSGGATRFASAFATGPDQADMHCKRGVFIRRHRWPGASCRRPAGTCHRSADDTHTVSRRRTRPGRGNGRWYRLYFRHDVGPQKIRVRPTRQADCQHGGDAAPRLSHCAHHDRSRHQGLRRCGGLVWLLGARNRRSAQFRDRLPRPSCANALSDWAWCHWVARRRFSKPSQRATPRGEPRSSSPPTSRGNRPHGLGSPSRSGCMDHQ